MFIGTVSFNHLKGSQKCPFSQRYCQCNNRKTAKIKKIEPGGWNSCVTFYIQLCILSIPQSYKAWGLAWESLHWALELPSHNGEPDSTMSEMHFLLIGFTFSYLLVVTSNPALCACVCVCPNWDKEAKPI